MKSAGHAWSKMKKKKHTLFFAATSMVDPTFVSEINKRGDELEWNKRLANGRQRELSGQAELLFRFVNSSVYRTSGKDFWNLIDTTIMSSWLAFRLKFLHHQIDRVIKCFWWRLNGCRPQTIYYFLMFGSSRNSKKKKKRITSNDFEMFYSLELIWVHVVLWSN